MYEFKSNLSEQGKKLEKEYQKNIADILGTMAQSYAAKALQYVPPGMTSKKQRISGKRIDKKLYKRSFVFIPKAIKDKNKILPSDLAYLHKKYFYRLHSLKKLSAKHGVETKNKGVKNYWYYFKTLRALKKFIKIKNRGLLKSMFGANLTSIKKSIPNVITNIMNKSKNLWELIKLNILEYSDNYSTLKISNEASKGQDSYLKIAVRQGEKAALKTMKKQFKKIMEINKKI